MGLKPAISITAERELGEEILLYWIVLKHSIISLIMHYCNRKRAEVPPNDKKRHQPDY